MEPLGDQCRWTPRCWCRSDAPSSSGRRDGPSCWCCCTSVSRVRKSEFQTEARRMFATRHWRLPSHEPSQRSPPHCRQASGCTPRSRSARDCARVGRTPSRIRNELAIGIKRLPAWNQAFEVLIWAAVREMPCTWCLSTRGSRKPQAVLHDRTANGCREFVIGERRRRAAGLNMPLHFLRWKAWLKDP